MLRVRTIAVVLACAALACGGEDAPDDDVLGVEPALEDADEALKADGSGSGVEIKVTIRADQVASAKKKFGLTNASATARQVWFYDTRTLQLFDAGLILRARKVTDGADDSTVKRRPLDPGDVDRDWFDVSGFKCEEDRVGTRAVPSCSLTVPQDRGEIGDVAAGKRTIDKLFSADQEAFLDEAPAALDWTKLKALGPTDAKVWKVTVSGFTWPITGEQWTLPDGKVLLELSIKTTRTKAADAQKKFAALLAKKSLDASDTQETKTRVALEYFAAH